MTDKSDDEDDFDLPPAEEDEVSTGAAADSSDLDERLSRLPRLLRYAMMVVDVSDHVPERLIAEIEELCPQLAQTSAWAEDLSAATGIALASELDKRAVVLDDPNLRSLADSVRLLCLPTPATFSHIRDHRRVGKALVQALRRIGPTTDEELSSDIERFVFGWAALPACTDLVPSLSSAAEDAATLGLQMVRHRIQAAKKAFGRTAIEEERRRKQAEEEQTRKAEKSIVVEPPSVLGPTLVVARLSPDEMKNGKLKDILGPLKGAINVPLPLIKVPPLYDARCALALEFPYALEVIDFALADLVGRTTIRLRPLLLLGDVGGGKTRFARRLGEVLGLPTWRFDASRADGAVFGGTDRRWYSAEPCNPFLAVAQHKVANPCVLIDEIEKAAVRTDYGRLWDCMLGFLEDESSRRYPDPALQTNLELSQISYLATANSIDPLPSPIRDRFRIVRFPNPGATHTDSLLPSVVADLMRERGQDREWIHPLDGAERDAVARYWKGGSVRRLRRIVEAILRERDINSTRH